MHLKYTEKYFLAYCKKFKDILEELNSGKFEDSDMNTSYVDLQRYQVIHPHLIQCFFSHSSDFSSLDAGCHIGLYVKFLQVIGINSYGIDVNSHAISLGQKFGTKNLRSLNLSNKRHISSLPLFDFISILHVFEPIIVIKNGDDFIYTTLNNLYSRLKLGGVIIFNVGEGYKKYDKDRNEYYHIECKFEIDKDRIMKSGYRLLEYLGRGIYKLTR